MTNAQIPLFVEKNPLLPPIPGLTYHKAFISKDREGALIAHADAHPWDTTWKRRVQQYGFSYGAGQRESLGPLPALFTRVSHQLVEHGIFSVLPNQVIVNEYLPGQGIAAHTDYFPDVSRTVASLSLLSPIVMDFIGPEDQKFSYLLESRSLFVLTGPAREVWKHGIAPRKKDKFAGSVIKRGRRISYTFRHLQTA
jgi:alkylated DNA repair dioxygenase AlkB